MTVIVSELYQALKSVGASDELARAAAQSVLSLEDSNRLATKADISEVKAAIAEAQAGTIKWMVSLTSVLLAILSAVVALLRIS